MKLTFAAGILLPASTAARTGGPDPGSAARSLAKSSGLRNKDEESHPSIRRVEEACAKDVETLCTSEVDPSVHKIVDGVMESFHSSSSSLDEDVPMESVDLIVDSVAGKLASGLQIEEVEKFTGKLQAFGNTLMENAEESTDHYQIGRRLAAVDTDRLQRQVLLPFGAETSACLLRNLEEASIECANSVSEVELVYKLEQDLMAHQKTERKLMSFSFVLLLAVAFLAAKKMRSQGRSTPSTTGGGRGFTIMGAFETMRRSDLVALVIACMLLIMAPSLVLPVTIVVLALRVLYADVQNGGPGCGCCSAAPKSVKTKKTPCASGCCGKPPAKSLVKETTKCCDGDCCCCKRAKSPDCSGCCCCDPTIKCCASKCATGSGVKCCDGGCCCCGDGTGCRGGKLADCSGCCCCDRTIKCGASKKCCDGSCCCGDNGTCCKGAKLADCSGCCCCDRTIKCGASKKCCDGSCCCGDGTCCKGAKLADCSGCCCCDRTIKCGASKKCCDGSCSCCDNGTCCKGAKLADCSGCCCCDPTIKCCASKCATGSGVKCCDGGCCCCGDDGTCCKGGKLADCSGCCCCDRTIKCGASKKCCDGSCSCCKDPSATDCKCCCCDSTLKCCVCSVDPICEGGKDCGCFDESVCCNDIEAQDCSCCCCDVPRGGDALGVKTGE